MERIKTTVRICGRDYTITGTGSEEQIKRVAVYVDRKMGELLHATRLPQPMVAVLTAMNIADDLMKAQDENTRLRRELLELKMGAGGSAAHASGTHAPYAGTTGAASGLESIAEASGAHRQQEEPTAPDRRNGDYNPSDEGIP